MSLPPGRTAATRWPVARPGAALGLAIAMAGALVGAVVGGLASGPLGPAAGAAPPATVAPAPSSGCTGTPVPPGSTTLSYPAGGAGRPVIVHVPPGDDGRTALPLVLNLHGSGSTAAAQEAFTGMDATADTDHFVVAYPQGAIASGTGFDWAVPGQPLAGGAPLPADAPNDVAYLTGLVADLEARYCLDRARIYATGFSGGGRMTSQLGCDASTVFAAVGPLSGLRRPVPCPATRPVPVISFHGTADPVDPYAGHGQAYWTYSVPTAARRWAAGDRCRSGPTVTHPDPTVTRSAWSGCAGGSAVVLYTVAGMGHRWPGGTPLPRRYDRLLGPPSDAIDANAVLWAFFDAHPMPTRPNGLPRTG